MMLWNGEKEIPSHRLHENEVTGMFHSHAAMVQPFKTHSSRPALSHCEGRGAAFCRIRRFFTQHRALAFFCCLTVLPLALVAGVFAITSAVVCPLSLLMW